MKRGTKVQKKNGSKDGNGSRRFDFCFEMTNEKTMNSQLTVVLNNIHVPCKHKL